MNEQQRKEALQIRQARYRVLGKEFLSEPLHTKRLYKLLYLMGKMKKHILSVRFPLGGIIQTDVKDKYSFASDQGETIYVNFTKPIHFGFDIDAPVGIYFYDGSEREEGHVADKEEFEFNVFVDYFDPNGESIFNPNPSPIMEFDINSTEEE